MVPADSDKISRVSPYSGYFLEVDAFRIRGYHPLWRYFPVASTIHRLCNSNRSPTTPARRLVWPVPRSLAATNRIIIYFIFLLVLRCFSSQGSRLTTYVFSCGQYEINRTRFPHSDITGSKLTSSSPMLFAGSHVLLRLHFPRHSPYALTIF